MKRWSLFLTLLSGMFLVPSAASQPVQDRPLRVAMYDSNFPFHPHLADSSTAHQIFTGLFEGLITLNPQSLVPEPGLAEAWTFSQDGRVLILTLRPNLQWSNGDPIRPQDVVDTWMTLLDPNSNSSWSALFDDVEGALEYRQGRLRERNRVGLSVQGNRQIQIRLRQPSPHFLSILAHYSTTPLHASMRRHNAPNPVGMVVSGPYQVSNFAQKRLTLVKNPRYWDERNVSIARIEILFSNDEDAVSRAYSRGELDWLDHIVNPDLILNRDDVQVNPTYSVSFLYFNASARPFDNPDIRRALVLMLNHDALREEQVFPSSTLVPPINPYPVPKGIEAANADEARELLTRAGYPPGRSLGTLQILLPESDYFKRLGALLQNAWQQVVSVVVNYVPWSQFYDRTKTDEYSLSFLSWIGDFPDPLTFLLLFEGASSLNQSRFRNAEYDRLLAQARSILNARERFALYSKAEEILLQTGAAIPIGFGYSVHVLDTSFIQGWQPNILDYYPYKHLRLTGNRLGPNLTQR